MKDLGGRRPRHRVIALVDAQGVVRHVGVATADRPAPWRAVWEHRHQLDSELARWLRTLDAEPKEVLLLGSVGMHAPAARAAARMLAEMFNVPVDEEIRCRRRVVARVEGEKLTVWPSVAAAARSLGVSRTTILHYVQHGRLLDGGCH